MLILLVGPKGSGKSHIGRLLEREFGVHFFHVEPLWMEYYAECEASGVEPTVSEGIRFLHPFVATAIGEHARLCIETTGASRAILDDLLSLSDPNDQLIVRVWAPLDVCLDRIEHRDQSNQIPLAEDEIVRIHELSSALDLPFDVTIENDAITDPEILQMLRVRTGLGA